MKQLTIIALFLNLAVITDSTVKIVIEGQSKISDDFHDMSEKCFRQQAVPQRYKTSFATFQYANDEVVHKYIRCVATELDIWDNRNGFNVEKIYHQYRAKANEEVVLPVINSCNQNSQDNNKDLWCYRAFLCILNSDVGTWFKEDVRRASNSSIPNGHH